MEVTAPHLTHAMPMLMPLNSERHRRPGRRHPRRPARPATCCAAAPAPAADTLPRPRRISATEALQLAPPLRPAGLRGGAALLGRPARGRRPAGHHHRPHGRGVRRPRPHPRPGAVARPAPRSSCATSSPARPTTVTRPRGRQRHRRLGRRPGRRGHAAAQPRHPPGAARRAPCPGCSVAVFAPVPGRRPTGSCWCCPSPTAPSTSASPTSRSTATIPDVPEPTEPEIGFLLDVVSAAFAAPLRRSDVVGAYAGLRPLLDTGRRRRDRRPVPQARRAHQPHRRGHGRRRQADDVPPDGRGRRRRRRRPRRARRRRRAAPATLPLLGAAAARRAGRGSSSRPGWSAASAPTPSWCSTTPATVTGLADDELLAPDRRRHPGHAGRAGLRRHPRGRRRRRRPARPAYPHRPGPRRPGARRTRRRAGAGAGRRPVALNRQLPDCGSDAQNSNVDQASRATDEFRRRRRSVRQAD